MDLSKEKPKSKGVDTTEPTERSIDYEKILAGM
jgi:hypothetical protein